MTEPVLRFLPLGVDLTKEEEDVLEKIHAALDRLTRRRKRRLLFAVAGLIVMAEEIFD